MTKAEFIKQRQAIQDRLDANQARFTKAEEAKRQAAQEMEAVVDECNNLLDELRKLIAYSPYTD